MAEIKSVTVEFQRYQPAREGSKITSTVRQINSLYDNYLYDFEIENWWSTKISYLDKCLNANEKGVEAALLTHMEYVFHMFKLFIPIDVELNEELLIRLIGALFCWRNIQIESVFLRKSCLGQQVIGNLRLVEAQEVNRVIIYYEKEISKELIDNIVSEKAVAIKIKQPETGINIRKEYSFEKMAYFFRGNEYHLAKKSNSMSKKCFISYDHADEKIANSIYEALIKLGSDIWYDRKQILPGDSIREQIENGVKECEKCIVVFSKDYIKNNRWAYSEFESFYSKEIMKGNRIFIPIWLNITKEDIYEYSSKLVSISAVNLPIDQFNAEDQTHKSLINDAALNIYRAVHGHYPPESKGIYITTPPRE